MSYKKYYVYKQQYSEDGGITWKDTDPLVTSPSGDPIGEYATLEECQGIVPPTPTGKKLVATYTGDTTREVECNDSTTLTTGETKPSGYQASAMTSAVIGDCVTSIGNSAFTNCRKITNIVISDGVTSIGYQAFSNCTDLTSITIPDSVTSIDESAFGYCTGLTGITVLATTPPTLGYGVFDNTSKCPIYVPCGRLSAYKSATNWSDYASRIKPTMPCDLLKLQESYSDGTTYELECNGSSELNSGEVINKEILTSAIIGDCVTSIGNEAFYKCSGLTRINSSINGVCNIPSGITTIGDNAFYSCSGLTSVTIPNSVTSLGSSVFTNCHSLTSITIPNSITSIGEGVFSSCHSLTSITIPNSVTSIGHQAFYYCSGLTSVTIPNSVTAIDEGAFWYCSGLTGVTVLAITPPTLGGTYVFNNTNNCPIYVPCGSLLAYKTAANWSTYATRIQGIPPCEEIYKIKNTYSDSSTYSLECNGNATLSSGETQPSGYQASAMTNSIIGDCVTSIGSSAFTNCSGLTSITIPNSVTNIGNRTFMYCTSITSITIPNSVTSIGQYAFNRCYSITGITIPSGVRSIGKGVFHECTDLTSITIPDSVTSIDEQAFYRCSGLTSCTIGSGVTSIGKSTFQGCGGLTSIDIPNSVTSINYAAFNSCSSLTSVTIGSGVTSIADQCFRGCYRLNSITINRATPPTLGGTYVFNNTNNCPIYVPSSSVEAYKTATNWRNYASRIQAIP